MCIDQKWLSRLRLCGKTLPRGPHNLSRRDVAESQRSRLTYAITALVDEKGYAATTVADLLREAGVSRKAFYEHFRDKPECFLAAYDAACDYLVEQTIAASSQEDPLAALHEAIRGYLTCLAGEPVLAKVFFVEIFSAGREALERRARAYERFAAVAREWHETARQQRPDFPAVPDAAYLAAVAATTEHVTEYIRAGRSADLLRLEPAIRYIYHSLLRIPVTDDVMPDE